MKTLISPDGGGLRAIILIACLEWIGALLAQDDGTLADHAYLIGGYPTGAVIASAVALGRTMHGLCWRNPT